MNKQQTDRPHVNPRVRAYGKARIDIAKRAKTREDWERLWKPPLHPFPFDWGARWRQCVEYKVDDFAAEVGFFIDVLGLPVVAFDPDYAMFTSPDEGFTFAVISVREDEFSTPPDAIRIQFMVADIFETTDELERRGIVFDQYPEPITEGSALFISSFCTPHGISVELWGMLESEEEDIGADFADFEEESGKIMTTPETASKIENLFQSLESEDEEEEFADDDEVEDVGDLAFEDEDDGEDNHRLRIEYSYEDDYLDDALPEDEEDNPRRRDTPDPLDRYRGGKVRRQMHSPSRRN